MICHTRVAVYSRSGEHVFTAHAAQAQSLLSSGRAVVKLKTRKCVRALELVDSIHAHIIHAPKPITLSALAGQRYTRRISCPDGGQYQEFISIDKRDAWAFRLAVTDNVKR